MNSIWRLRAAGLLSTAPPGAATKPPNGAGVPRGVVALDEPDGVRAVRQAVDPVRGVAGRDERGDGGSVDLDVVVGGRVVQHDAHAGAADAALEVHAGPAVLHGVSGVLDPPRGVHLCRALLPRGPVATAGWLPPQSVNCTTLAPSAVEAFSTSTALPLLRLISRT